MTLWTSYLSGTIKGETLGHGLVLFRERLNEQNLSLRRVYGDLPEMLN